MVLPLQVDLLDHAGGDEGGLHAEKVCGGQVIIAAHAQSKDTAGLDPPGGKLLDLAKGIVALRGDHAVMLKALFIDDPDGLCLQLRCGRIGLYLDVQLDPAFALIQNFFSVGTWVPVYFWPNQRPASSLRTSS